MVVVLLAPPRHLKIQPYNPLALQVGHLTGLIGCWPGKVCKLPQGGSCWGTRRGGEGRGTWEVSAGFFTKSFGFPSHFLHQDGDLRFAFEKQTTSVCDGCFDFIGREFLNPPSGAKKKARLKVQISSSSFFILWLVEFLFIHCCLEWFKFFVQEIYNISCVSMCICFS